MKHRILIVCTGNICRSPMAAALLQARIAQAGENERYLVSSAGTWGLERQPAAEFARAAMQTRGLSLAQHAARTITRESVDQADLILVMTRDHQYALAAEFPQARPKIHLISQLAGREYDIADPYGSERADYETCAAELANLIETGYPLIAAWIARARLTPTASASV